MSKRPPPAFQDFRHRRYRLLGLLGQGGMGSVYRAEDLLEDGQAVALKVYPPGTHADLLRREFLGLRSLRHPGIARAYHFGVSESDGAPFFTMELVAGLPLDRHLEARRKAAGAPLPAGAALRGDLLLHSLDLCLQAASAAHHLHRRGLLHLDLKPANMLVVERDAARAAPLLVLIDFGLLQKIGSSAKGPRRGTVPFLAPEVFEGAAADSRADVYALGVTLYLALSGRFPLEAGTIEGWAQAHRTGAPAPAPEIPRALERVVLKALAKDPARRFPDAGALRQSLLAVRVELCGPVPAARSWAVEAELSGRAAELSRFEAWRDRGRQDRPTLFVKGADGTGKTRFLSAIETSLEMAGHQAVLVHCPEEGEAPLLREVVRRASLLYPERMEPPGDPAGAALLRGLLGPERAEPRARRLVEMLPPGEALRIARQIAVLRVAGLLREEPVFLVVDDFDAAGAADREFLIELALALGPSGAKAGGSRPSPGLPEREARPGPRGGIIAALRSAREAVAPVLALARARRAGLTWLSLGPLSEEDSRRLLESAAAELSDGFPTGGRLPWSEIHRRAGGNPLYLLEELGAHLEGAERQPPRDHGLRARRRLASLSGLSRQMTSLLAAAGRALPLEILAPAAGAGPEAVARTARELSFAGILAGGPGKDFWFARRFLPPIALGLVPEAERPDLHRRLAAAIEEALAASRRNGARRGDDGSALLLWDLAHHLFGAGETGRAVAVALELAGEPGPPAPGGPRVFSVLEQAARALGVRAPGGRLALSALGDRLAHAGRFDQARRVWQELSAAPRLVRLERARALRKLAAASHRLGRMAEAERLSRKALHLLPRAGAGGSLEPALERLAALAELALLHHFRQSPRLASRFAREGLRLFRGIERRLPAGRGPEAAGALQRAIDLHGVAGQIAIRALQLDLAAQTLERGLQLAASAGAQVNAALLLNNLGLAHHLRSRFAEALLAFRRAARTAEAIGDSAAMATIRSNVAQIHAKRGRFSKALEELDRLREEPAVARSPRLRLSYLYTRALVQSLQLDLTQDWREVRALARGMGDRFLEGFAAVYESEAEMARGSWSHARAALRGIGGPAAALLAPARLARIEAALGRSGDRPRSHSGTTRSALPDLAEAWSRLHMGQALADGGDLEGGREELLAADGFFRARGVIPGEIEACLLLADLDLRRAASAPAGLRHARDWIERARQAPADSPGGLSPRLRALRIDLLSARAEMRSALAGSDFAPCLTRARDLLAAAGGEPALRGSPELGLELEALQLALARLSGDRDVERAAQARFEEACRKRDSLLTAADRRAARRVDVLARLGLGELSAERRKPSWPGWAGEALAEALGALAAARNSGADRRTALGAVLRAVARPAGARAALALAADGGRSPQALSSWPDDLAASQGRRLLRAAAIGRGWRAPAAATARRVAGGTMLLVPLREAGSPRGGLWLFFAGGMRSGAIELIRSAADAISAAGYFGETGAFPVGSADARGPSAPATVALAGRTRTVNLEDRPAAFGLLGKSPAFRKLLVMIRAAAATDLPVLVTGESGTGKEAVARAIHLAGHRAQGPFITQNCTAIPAGLLEADLFGYERGSFSGADRTRSGFILRAAGGTFLLDEIADSPPEIQAKLLRVISERAIRPVGGRRAVPVDVRFVAVTQRDIDLLVERGEFRRDLFYRLAGLRVHVPPLRERSDDVVLLLEHFLHEALGRAVRVSPRARAPLLAHSWPGNVREVQTVARRLALDLEGSGSLRASGIEAALAGGRVERPPGPIPPGLLRSHPYPELRRALETEHLRNLWTRHQGDLAALASELNTTVRSVYRRFERLGLKPRQFRQNLSVSGDLG